jgi:hypothetical protein
LAAVSPRAAEVHDTPEVSRHDATASVGWVRLWLGCVAACALAVASPALAQHEMHDMSAMSADWTWTFDTQAFLNANLQERKFRDFHQIESQNWFMVGGARRLGAAAVHVHGMFSLEPFTIRPLGSAEVFQTGETYNGLSLIDYQHPHDLVMGAGAAVEWPASADTRARFEAAAVGEAALGPPAFMHRPSAEANPTAPLSHHNLDSTHIAYDVLTAGLATGEITIEASAFHGREPNEHRLEVQIGPIDSYSARLSWRRGPWQAQVSGGHLKFPDPTEFTDIDRFTASLSYTGAVKNRPAAFMLAWGLNREPGVGVTSPAWLAEGVCHVSTRHLVFLRAELVDKDILTVGGYDPPGYYHLHVLSWVGALTLGAERELATTAAGQVGVGADATVYRTPANLLDSYGHPFSAHIFLRYRFAR